MMESLTDLNDQLKGNMNFMIGNNIDIIKEINKKNNIKIIIENKDFTPYAVRRSNAINDYCIKNKIEYL